MTVRLSTEFLRKSVAPAGASRYTHLRRMLSESLSASTTLQCLLVIATTLSSKATVPVQKHLVLLGASNDVQHNVRLHLEDDNLLVVEYDVRCLLGRLLCLRCQTAA